jgi:phosphate-selective porin OprO/OprP
MAFRTLSRWFALGICSCGLSSVQAQSPDSMEMTEMARRLEAAERRIVELEARRLPAVEAVQIFNTDWQGAEDPAASEETGAAESLADRVEALEKELEAQDEAAAEAKAEAAKRPSVKISGRIHADYWAFPGEDDGANLLERGDPTLDIQDRFLFRRVRIGAAGNILETMLYKFEMEFASPNDPTFKDAYIGWTELPYLRTLLLGLQKRPYGLDHLNSSRYNVFLERPNVIEAFNQDARRFGLCSYGVSRDEAYNWRFGAFLQNDMSGLGSYLAVDDPGLHHYQGEFAGRFANTIWYDEVSDGRGYAHWAIAGTAAFPDGTAGGGNEARFRTRPEARTSERWLNTDRIVGADEYQLLGLEGVINVGAFQWVGELQSNWLQRTTDPEVQTYGGYMYVSYFLTGEHIPWDRESGTIDRVKPLENFFLVDRCSGGHGHGWGAWQVAARYSYADFNDHDIFGGIGKSFTFGLNWHWTPYSRMQFNYIIGDIEDQSTDLIDANYHIIGSRFMVDF